MGESGSRPILEHLRFLHEMGIEALPLPPETSAAAPAAGTDSPGVSAPPSRPASTGAVPPAPLPVAPGQGEKLAAIRADMGDCTRCRLSEGRTQIVFGVGHPAARLLFVGEAPGADEDRQGEPFVGRAGQLLDKMIAAIGMRRADVYIANIVKCRPPGNRNPQPDEIDACGGFLQAQVEAIAPQAMVALGKFAASTLLGEDIAITRARGTLRSYRGIPLMPTLHPAYLLRQYTRENRQAVYDDLLAVKRLLDGEAR